MNMNTNYIPAGVVLSLAAGYLTLGAAGSERLTESARQAAKEEAAKQILEGGSGESAARAVGKAAAKGAAQRAASDAAASSSASEAGSGIQKLKEEGEKARKNIDRGREPMEKINQAKGKGQSGKIGGSLKKEARQETKKAVIRKLGEH